MQSPFLVSAFTVPFSIFHALNLSKKKNILIIIII